MPKNGGSNLGGKSVKQALDHNMEGASYHLCLPVSLFFFQKKILFPHMFLLLFPIYIFCKFRKTFSLEVKIRRPGDRDGTGNSTLWASACLPDY